MFFFILSHQLITCNIFDELSPHEGQPAAAGGKNKNDPLRENSF
jgi:hypothetical protein